MSDEVVTPRGLRNDTGGPLQPAPRSWIRRDDLVARLRRAQADPALRADLARLTGETTEDAEPIR